MVPDLSTEVCGSFALVTGLILAGLQFRRLRVVLIYIVTIRRHHGVTTSVSTESWPRRASRLRQVALAPSGFFVRQALFTAAFGLWLVTGWWPVVVVEGVIIAWTINVWVRALSRGRQIRRVPVARRQG
jgi:hypothetical protein